MVPTAQEVRGLNLFDPEQMETHVTLSTPHNPRGASRSRSRTSTSPLSRNRSRSPYSPIRSPRRSPRGSLTPSSPERNAGWSPHTPR